MFIRLHIFVRINGDLLGLRSIFSNPHQVKGGGPVCVFGIHRRHGPQVGAVYREQGGHGICFAHHGGELDQPVGGKVIAVILAGAAAVSLYMEQTAVVFPVVGCYR